MLTLCRASPMCSSLLTFDSSSDFGCAADIRAEGARIHVQQQTPWLAGAHMHGSAVAWMTCVL